jgi:V/A-type H+-transporting ATPase subunit E
MSLDAIKKSILSDAEARASAMDGDADSEARRILKEADEKAKTILKDAELAAAAESERLRKEAQASAETEANSILLEAKGEAVERALKKVVSQAERTLSKDYAKRLFDSGLRQFKEISGPRMVIKTSKKNAAMFRGGKYNVEYADISGFMFYTEDGKIALNATIPNIVDKEKDVARKFISRELFAETGTRPGVKRVHAGKAGRPKKAAKAGRKQKGKKKRG